ncbi:uncharacterized protein [Henckelia pumila]|uniref:uncharacterized protein n=1 Tax=Henckelia pumila TaxID=405737 RepID=UPI003C6E26A9
MVTAWLINSMEPAIGKPFMFLPTASDVWEAVKETYSDLENYSQLYDLNTRMWRQQQGNRDVTSYYNELLTIWQELDFFETDEWESKNDCCRYRKNLEHGRVFVFLARLNKELDEVRGRLLGRKPLPSLREIFSEVRREEAQRHVMLQRVAEQRVETEGSALISNGKKPASDYRDGGKQKPW